MSLGSLIMPLASITTYMHKCATAAHSRPIFPFDILGLMSKDHLELNMPKLNSLFLPLAKPGSFQGLSVAMTPALSPS